MVSLIRKVEEHPAYAHAMEGYVYGFPLVLMDTTRRVLTAVPRAGEYAAPLGQFARMRGFVDPACRDLLRMSRNTLYAHAFVDLDEEPVVYSHPDTAGRYTVMQALDMWTDDFASVGTRTAGGGAGDYLLAGPNWRGVPPPDVKHTFWSRTRYAWVIVQIAAAGAEDFPEVHALQDRLRLTPLTLWGHPEKVPEDAAVDPSVDPTATPYDQVRLMSGVTFFQRLAELLGDNPPDWNADEDILRTLEKLGVEPGVQLDPATIDPHRAEAMNRAAKHVWCELESVPLQIPTVNGWVLPLNLGRFGTDYTMRAVVAWLGLGALTAPDAIYPTAFVDADGVALDGGDAYVLHLEDGVDFPSYSGIWSISAYRENFFVPNPVDRYAITSTMPLKRNADGSLDLYVQAHSPGPGKEQNWLPCPPSGPFNVTIRVYQPKPDLLDGREAENHLVVSPGSYAIPPLTRIRPTSTRGETPR